MSFSCGVTLVFISARAIMLSIFLLVVFLYLFIFYRDSFIKKKVVYKH